LAPEITANPMENCDRSFGHAIIGRNDIISLIIEHRFDAILRRILRRRRRSRVFAGPQRQVAGHHINHHQGEHQHHCDPDSPIAVRVLPKVVSWVFVIPWLGAVALHIVLVRAHFVFVLIAAEFFPKAFKCSAGSQFI
jgi:hypothetical protein